MPRDKTRKDTPLAEAIPLPESVQELTELNISKSNRLSKDESIARRRLLLREYSKGATIEQLGFMFKMKEDAVEREIAQAYNLFTHYFSATKPHHTFVRYAAFQFDILRKLQSAYDSIMNPPPIVDPVTGKTLPQAPAGRQTTAAIQALRAQSDVMDKIIDKGIEFGVIERKLPQSLSDLLRMTPSDLKIELRQEITNLTLLLDEVDGEVIETFRNERGDDEHGYKILVKPLTDSNGVIQYGYDWKRIDAIYDEDGKPIPKSKLTDDQKTLLEEAQQLKELEELGKQSRLVVRKEQVQKRIELNS